MGSDFSYRFTEKAMQDLEQILQYISADLDNPIAAQSLGRKVFEKIDLVTAFPDAGAPMDNELLLDKTLRKLPVDHYIIYYKAHHEEKMITVVRIVYGKRNLDEILRSL